MTATDRRGFFGMAAGLAAAGSVSTARADAPKTKPLRVAHITDVHITDGGNAAAGMAKLFAHMHAADWAPEIVLNTGDAVMAVDGKVTAARAQVQIDLWQSAAKLAKVPIYSCLGNHDVWGGHEPTAAVPATKKGFALMVEALGMPADQYAFEHGGWHFIALNSVGAWPDYGVLTPEHFRWLKQTLAAVPKDRPVCVLSHLPIVSVTSSLYGKSRKRPDGVHIPKTWQHQDCWEISEIFRKHPNVKLCLSGHMHTCDRVEYRGVWYICGGAASGAWWNGSEYGFPPCYGRIDLNRDGTFEYHFIDYGWTARDWKGDQLS
jgi:3',5'-cyclic-AMP phosphodiesterase